jgi:hypothetical protein
MAGSESCRYVVLRGGLALPVEPVVLLLGLEARGFSVRRDGDALVVQPYHQLTRDDCAAIRRWKAHLLALVDYEAPRCA